MRNYKSSASLAALVVAAGLASASHAFAADQPASVEEVIVTGTRQVGIKAADSPAPIQLVGAQVLKKGGSTDLATSLAANVPSMNIQTTGGDAAAVQIQAALRGLGPNDSLVLVDGKRRHTTSNLAVDSGSAYTGSATTDLSFIPVGLIDHVEVLTDGAAAQYGSDAIAGVVNIILKHGETPATLTLTGGQYFNGQGDNFDVSFDKGFNLGDRGYFDIALEEHYHEFTFTGIGDNRVTDSSGNLLPGLPYPNSNSGSAFNFPHVNMLNGDPQFNLYNAMFNSAYKLNDDIEFYSFGSFGYRTAWHYENFRRPSVVEATTSTGAAVLPFPYGFDPREKFDETDYSFTAGLRGVAAGWHWDLSTTYGGNHVDAYTVNSANPGLFSVLQGLSPTPITPQTNFYDGSFDATEWTTDLDFEKLFTFDSGPTVDIAFGGEFRRDTFAIGAGEPSSYEYGGGQSFEGYLPAEGGNWNRDNYSAYVDVAVNPIKNLHLDVAGRYEHYSDFGNATVGKFTGRYDFNDMFAIRGTVSTGFRAPTLAEEHYFGVNVAPSSAFGQLPPNSAAAALAGFNPLKPEKSDNYSVGFVLHPAPNLQFTVDAYDIELHDRIINSGDIFGLLGGETVSQNVLNAVVSGGITLPTGVSTVGIQIFSNTANTSTKGVEVTGSYASDFGDFGHVDWTLGFNYNKTDITRLFALPEQVTVPDIGQTSLLTAQSETALTNATPRYKIVLQALWTLHRWSATVRETIYGPTAQWSAAPSDMVYYQIGATGITDLDIGYKFSKNIQLDVGANNLFNIIPPGIQDPASNFGHVFNAPYAFAPWNPNGGYYYGKLTFTF